MQYWCSFCKEPISDKEYDYSRERFNKALCRTHQKNTSSSKSIVQTINKSTPEARKLAKLLQQSGWKVELEKFDGYKKIDLAIVEARVNLEIDGIHHNVNMNQALADLQRTYHSFKKGYVTLRIPNCLVRDDAAIYKTAHFVNAFLNKSVEMLDKEEKEAENNGGFLDWVFSKIKE